ncbi:antibiotic biosynthesis monooxygenase [Rhizoctonia solani AG-3 Rhs1AP]|uniref:Antibiotic biosynthesis monooxygenase n=1 Tax=Rhizoctonia solani AG-3 Rhs1AP TaxID=1086054 RepID=X8J3U2_9AGAM|nr:antibiotic biosynthesis monooxygenase [Rhizoctonia solani AG-3 Rhs1AP]
MADSFEHFTGKIIVHALFTAEDSHADELTKAIKAIQEYALSDKEPGCLTYRVNRSGNKFFIFEEYINAGAITEHRNTPPYLALGELVTSKPMAVPGSRQVSFYEEI